MLVYVIKCKELALIPVLIARFWSHEVFKFYLSSWYMYGLHHIATHHSFTKMTKYCLCPTIALSMCVLFTDTHFTLIQMNCAEHHGVILQQKTCHFHLGLWSGNTPVNPPLFLYLSVLESLPKRTLQNPEGTRGWSCTLISSQEPQNAKLNQLWQVLCWER